MSDKIVSVSQEADFATISDRSGVRLDGKGPYFRLHFASVFVRDQERSIRFFVDKLGFTLIADVSFARLIEELRSNHRPPSAELANTIVQKVLHFSAPEQFDDTTLIIAKRVAAQR
jgi:hypothetical protein